MQHLWRVWQSYASPLWRWCKWGLVCILLLFLMAPFLYRWRQLWLVPDIGHPFDFQAYGQDIVIPPEENAAAEYELVAKYLEWTEEPPSSDVYSVLEEDWSVASDELKNWLDANQQLFDIWLPATQKPYVHIGPISDETINKPYSLFNPMWDMANYAGCLAKEAESQGKLDEAWNWLLASCRQSRQCANLGGINARLRASRIHSVTTQGIIDWARYNELTPSELNNALSQVRELNALTLQRSVAVRYEYMKIMKELEDVDSLRRSVQYVRRTLPVDFSQLDIPKFPGEIKCFLTHEPEHTRRLLKHQIENLLQFVDHPFNEWPRFADGDAYYFDHASATGDYLPPQDFLRALNRTDLDYYILIDYKSMAYLLKREAAQQAMLEVLLCCELYRRQQGHYPEQLDDIIDGELLKSAPVDPYSPAADAILYERDSANSSKIKVWCRGGNEVDDGCEFSRNPEDGYPLDIGYVIGD